MYHIKATSQFKLCSWFSSNLRLVTFHSGHQDKRAAPLHNMLLISGSICLDATYMKSFPKRVPPMFFWIKPTVPS